MKRTGSQRLFQEAQRVLPGGVNSPVRAFAAVGGCPPFIERARGSHIWDADGNEYVDFVGSWGPMILGHAHPDVLRAIRETAKKGTSFGAPTALEVALAKKIVKFYPSIEQVRMVSSGTEAVMSAIRLARAFTRRDLVVKFDGCYHGHADHLLVKAGSGVATLGIPDTRGIPEDFARHTLVARYNDLPSVAAHFAAHENAVAAVIVEPVAGNMGVVPPADGFLAGLRDLTRKNGALLIFDEVITGFRVARGGAQALYGVRPDLTCLGKILGGGLPAAAYGGGKEIMGNVAPLGPVYQAGTLSGNPLAMSAGIATLNPLSDALYRRLDVLTADLCAGIRTAARQAGVPVTVNRVGSLFTIFFTGREVTDYDSAKGSDTGRHSRFFRTLLDEGIYPPPSQFEAWFVSAAHREKDVERTLSACRKAFSAL